MTPNDHHRYAPVGYCIYCGAADGTLSDEHIVPFALNGRLILPDASCSECAKKTAKNEEVCTAEKWGMFYPLRARFKLMSRRKWKGRDSIGADITRPDGSIERQIFDSGTMPVLAYGLELPPAGILLGEAPTNSLVCPHVFRYFAPSEGFAPQGERGLVKIGSFNSTAFFQLLAKIGYSFAAAETGTEGLLPTLADFILWKSDTPTYLIGGGYPYADGFRNSMEPTEYFYRLQMHEADIGESPFTFVSVHLFGQIGMPYYHVIVRQRPKDQ